MSEERIRVLDGLLPQTQCGRCGYPGCRAYAEALVTGVAANRCPPGGEQTARALAEALGRDYLPPEVRRFEGFQPEVVAYIREPDCIGCAKCIQVCPTAAIVGALHFSHTVIPEACTGCDLCLEPCPTDCIDLIPVATPFNPDTARQAFATRETRRQATERQPLALNERSAPVDADAADMRSAASDLLRLRLTKTAAALARARTLGHASASTLQTALHRLQQQTSPTTDSTPTRRQPGKTNRARKPQPRRTTPWRQPPATDRLN